MERVWQGQMFQSERVETETEAQHLAKGIQIGAGNALISELRTSIFFTDWLGEPGRLLRNFPSRKAFLDPGDIWILVHPCKDSRISDVPEVQTRAAVPPAVEFTVAVREHQRRTAVMRTRWQIHHDIGEQYGVEMRV